MDHENPQLPGGLRAGDLDLPALVDHMTRIRGVDAGQDFHQRGLAGAVFADERVHLARHDVQADVLYGEDAGETLGDVAETNQRLGDRGARSMGGLKISIPVVRETACRYGQASLINAPLALTVAVDGSSGGCSFIVYSVTHVSRGSPNEPLTG